MTAEIMSDLTSTHSLLMPSHHCFNFRLQLHLSVQIHSTVSLTVHTELLSSTMAQIIKQMSLSSTIIGLALGDYFGQHLPAARNIKWPADPRGWPKSYRTQAHLPPYEPILCTVSTLSIEFTDTRIDLKLGVGKLFLDHTYIWYHGYIPYAIPYILRALYGVV